MKKLTRTSKFLVAMLSLFLVFTLGITSEAAYFKQGTTYVAPDADTDEPATNSKNEYYSIKKYRMSTYDDKTIRVYYPKDASISVSTNKPKKFEAKIVEYKNEDIYSETGTKTYKEPTYKEIGYHYVKKIIPNVEASNIPEEYAKVYQNCKTSEYIADFIVDWDDNDEPIYEKRPVTLTGKNVTILYYNKDMQDYTEKNVKYVFADNKYLGNRILQYDENGEKVIDAKTGKYVYVTEEFSPVAVKETVYNPDWRPSNTNTSWKTTNMWKELSSGKYFNLEHKYDSVYKISTPYFEYRSGVEKYDPVYYEDPTTKEWILMSRDKAGYFYSSGSDIKYVNSQTEYYDGTQAPYEYAYADIQMTSAKSGTYKVNIIVNGVKTTVTVLVTPYGNNTYTKAKLGSSTLYQISKKETAKKTTTTTSEKMEVKSKLTSDKLKLTANKKIKITGLVYAYIDANGKAMYKKVKNGGKIKLSQEYYKNDRYGVKGSKSRDKVKNTYVFVSYKDTFLKTSCTYTVVKKNGVKQIKIVEKRQDGKKYTSFIQYGDAYSPLTLWSY